jgi:hypothetical protein
MGRLGRPERGITKTPLPNGPDVAGQRRLHPENRDKLGSWLTVRFSALMNFRTRGVQAGRKIVGHSGNATSLSPVAAGVMRQKVELPAPALHHGIG